MAAGVITAGTLIGATFPAAAQQVNAPYTAAQCHQIRANILGIFARYHGQISGELVADLKEFSRRDCDRSVPIRMMEGTRDRDAVGELRTLIAARRAAAELAPN